MRKFTIERRSLPDKPEVPKKPKEMPAKKYDGANAAYNNSWKPEGGKL